MGLLIYIIILGLFIWKIIRVIRMIIEVWRDSKDDENIEL